jgi:hypothetical protein
VVFRLIERVDEFIFHNNPTTQEQVKDLADVLAFWNLPYVPNRTKVVEEPSFAPDQFLEALGWIYGCRGSDLKARYLLGSLRRSPHKELEWEPLKRMKSPRKVAGAVREQLVFVERHHGQVGRVAWLGEVLTKSGLVPCVTPKKLLVPRLDVGRVARLLGAYPEHFAELVALLQRGKVEQAAAWLLNQRRYPLATQVAFLIFAMGKLAAQSESSTLSPLALLTLVEQVQPEVQVDPSTLN